MNILLIAGHGAGDPGAVGNGYKEADLTREVAALVKSALAKYATTDIADTKKNWYEQIFKKGQSFNFRPYNYVLEIHFNAGASDSSGNGKTTGTEIFVTTSEKGVTVEEGIVAGISSLGFRNRGVKYKNWGLIDHIKRQGVSAALLEVCFIDDKDDMKIYAEKKKEIAEAIAWSIAEGFGLKAEEPEPVAKAVPSSWAKESFDKATAKGILDGTNPQGAVTREMLAVVLDRLGLLDK